MKTRKTVFLIALLIFVTVSGTTGVINLGSGPMAVSAQSKNTCHPLNIVMMIDQSSSMRLSDRNNQRITAVKDFLTRLFVLSGLYCDPLNHKITVIDFSTEASTPAIKMRTFTSVDISDPELETLIANLQGQIIPREGEQTNFGAAFQLAKRLFDESPGDETKAIIVLTDGLPCVSNSDGGVRHCTNPEYIREYFFADSFNPPPSWRDDPPSAGLFAQGGLVNWISSNFPSGQFAINVLFFQSEDEVIGNAVRAANEAWQQVASTHNGTFFGPEHFQNKSRTELINVLSPIINDLMNMQFEPVSCLVPFFLEPYTSSTTIFNSVGEKQDLDDLEIAHLDSDLVIRNGQARNAPPGFSVQAVAALDSVARYKIVNPPPGRWVVKSSTDNKETCTNIRSDFQTVSVTATQRSLDFEVEKGVVVNIDINNKYETPTCGGANSDLPCISFELRERGSGGLFAQILQYPLVVEGRVVSKTGNQDLNNKLRDIKLTFRETEPGIWVLNEPLPAPVQGDYILVITGRTNSIKGTGTTIEIFPPMTVEYTTRPPEKIRLEPVTPVDGAVSSANTLDGATPRNSPVAVEVRLVRESDPKASERVSAVFPHGQGNQSVEAIVITPDGVKETFFLSPNPNDSSSLVGTFGKFEDEIRPGDYQISFRVSPNAPFNNENYEFSSLESEKVKITRNRKTGVQMRLTSETKGLSLLLLNTIVSNQPVAQVMLINLQLVNEKEESLGIDQIFENSTEAIQARLRRPGTDQPFATFSLSPSTKDRSVLESEILLQPDWEGDALLDFKILVPLSEEKSKVYEIIKGREVTEAIPLKFIGRTGVSAEIIMPKTSDIVNLNSLMTDASGKWSQYPNEVPISIQFKHYREGSAVDPNVRLGKTLSLASATAVKLTDSSGNLVGSVVTLDKGTIDAAGGTVSIKLPITADFIRKPGEYAVTFVLDSNNLNADADALAAFELITPQSEVRFKAREISGLTLELCEIAGVTPDPANSIPTPLYVTLWDAVISSQSNVPIAFVLRDTNGEIPKLSSVFNEVDPAKIPEKLAKAFQVTLTNAENPQPIRLSSFESGYCRDGQEAIRTIVDSHLGERGGYTLEFMMDDPSSHLADNFTLVSNPAQTQRFTREVTDWLHDPNTYRVAKITLVFLLIAFVLNLLRVNGWLPIFSAKKMSGEMTYTLVNGKGTRKPYEIFVKLQGIRLFRNVKSFRGSTVNDDKVTIRFRGTIKHSSDIDGNFTVVHWIKEGKDPWGIEGPSEITPNTPSLGSKVKIEIKLPPSSSKNGTKTSFFGGKQ